jgi:hypothetical protein
MWSAACTCSICLYSSSKFWRRLTDWPGGASLGNAQARPPPPLRSVAVQWYIWPPVDFLTVFYLVFYAMASALNFYLSTFFSTVELLYSVIRYYSSNKTMIYRWIISFIYVLYRYLVFCALWWYLRKLFNFVLVVNNLFLRKEVREHWRDKKTSFIIEKSLMRLGLATGDKTTTAALGWSNNISSRRRYS